MSHIPDLVASLKSLAEKATPGPWHLIDDHRISVGDEFRQPIADFWMRDPKGIQTTDNARFVAAANPAAVLALIDRLEAAERVVEAARTAQQALANNWFGDYPDDPGGRNNDDIIEADELLQTRLAAFDRLGTGQAPGGEGK